jgi:hypothetical protein
MTERDTDFIMQKFIKKSSNKNAVMLKKNYMLFIADIKIEDGIIGGRIIKIRTGLYRRINIDDGNEWFEELKRQNAIEFETYVVLNLKLNTMIATYNSDSFGIMDKNIQNYFKKILNTHDNSIRIAPLALPDAIKLLLESKYVEKAEFYLKGDQVRILEDMMGEGLKNIILGDKVDPLISISIKANYAEASNKIDNFKKIIDYFTSRKYKIRLDQKAILQTETGYYSLIRDTLLNDLVTYDEDSEEVLNTKVFGILLDCMMTKINLERVKKSIEISEKDRNLQGDLDQDY